MQIVFLISLLTLSGMLFFKNLEEKSNRRFFVSENLGKVAVSAEGWFLKFIKKISRFDRVKIKNVLFDVAFAARETYSKIQDITHKKVSSMSRAAAPLPDIEDKKESSVFLKDVGDYKREIREEEKNFGARDVSPE